jgi:hypothetical protein
MRKLLLFVVYKWVALPLRADTCEVEIRPTPLRGAEVEFGLI